MIALSPPLVSVQVTITWSPALAVPDPTATFETWRSGYCASVDVTDTCAWLFVSPVPPALYSNTWL